MSKWAILCVATLGLSPFVSASDWPTYLGDNARSGSSPEHIESAAHRTLGVLITHPTTTSMVRP